MNVKLLLPKDADFCVHGGGYECEWAYSPQKKQLLLGIQKYSSIEYIFILFEDVVGYQFSNRMFDELRENLSKEEIDGFLFEVKSEEVECQVFKHYLTLQLDFLTTLDTEILE